MDSYIDLFESVACKQTYRMKAGVDAVVEAATKDLQAQLDAANAQIVELKGSLSVHEKLCTEGVYFTDSELDVARAYWLKKARVAYLLSSR